MLKENKQKKLENEMKVKEEVKYTKEEIDSLRDFVELVKNDEERAVLACWGNHAEYCKGY